MIVIRMNQFFKRGLTRGLLVVTMIAAFASAQEAVPHPQAVPNNHKPGEVDRPELVPLIVREAGSLPGLVIDEFEAELIGVWQYSTHTPPYVGLGYLHDQGGGKGKKSVVFPISIEESGHYEVRLSHCYNLRRATNTPVTLHHANGVTQFRINQQEVPPHGGLFRTLGIFRFEKDESHWLKISNDGTKGKYVIADAIQLLRVSDE